MVNQEIIISKWCKKSMPCVHGVTFPSGECKSMRGDEIYKIISENHSMYNHFKYCEEWIKNTEQRHLEFEERQRKNDEYWAEMKEQRRLEDEASNYNKVDEYQPSFRIKNSQFNI